jgi:hypothetical protein
MLQARRRVDRDTVTRDLEAIAENGARPVLHRQLVEDDDAAVRTPGEPGEEMAVAGDVEAEPHSSVFENPETRRWRSIDLDPEPRQTELAVPARRDE